MHSKEVVICGAGPAGLFASYLLLEKGFKVTLIDKSSGAGKKYLIAGHSGLNITHGEDLTEFLKKYSPQSSIVTDSLKHFTPEKIISFYNDKLQADTFIGSTGHVFPKEMKAGKILLRWLEILKNNENFKLITGAELRAIDSNSIKINYKNEELELKANFFIYALGGASWKKTGSTGDWFHIFNDKGVTTESWQPQNCGYIINWSSYIKENLQNTPLKNISLTLAGQSYSGEVMLTNYGIEGQLIYQLTHLLSSHNQGGEVVSLSLDLKPGLTEEKIQARLGKQLKKSSLSTKLKKSLNLSKTEIMLLNEYRNIEDHSDHAILAKRVKKIELPLISPRPIDEAISTSGGVNLSECSEKFELTKLPNHFCVGEMLAWSAPTGGYLLSACMSTAWMSAMEISQRN